MVLKFKITYSLSARTLEEIGFFFDKISTVSFPAKKSARETVLKKHQLRKHQTPYKLPLIDIHLKECFFSSDDSALFQFCFWKEIEYWHFEGGCLLASNLQSNPKEIGERTDKQEYTIDRNADGLLGHYDPRTFGLFIFDHSELEVISMKPRVHPPTAKKIEPERPKLTKSTLTSFDFMSPSSDPSKDTTNPRHSSFTLVSKPQSRGSKPIPSTEDRKPEVYNGCTKRIFEKETKVANHFFFSSSLLLVQQFKNRRKFLQKGNIST